MKIPNMLVVLRRVMISLARIVSEDSQHAIRTTMLEAKSSKDS